MQSGEMQKKVHLAIEKTMLLIYHFGLLGFDTSILAELVGMGISREAVAKRLRSTEATLPKGRSKTKFSNMPSSRSYRKSKITQLYAVNCDRPIIRFKANCDNHTETPAPEGQPFHFLSTIEGFYLSVEGALVPKIVHHTDIDGNGGATIKGHSGLPECLFDSIVTEVLIACIE